MRDQKSEEEEERLEGDEGEWVGGGERKGGRKEEGEGGVRRRGSAVCLHCPVPMWLN